MQRLHVPPSLHHRKFRLLWLGLMISVAGSQMQTWAIFWHIRDLTPLEIALGGVGLARLVPLVLFSLVGGAVADMYNRRVIMFATQTLMAATAVILAWLTLRGEIRLWHIYALTALQAVGIAFDTPARQSLVPNLVPARDIPNAFSMSSISFQTGAIAGPALSGLVIAYLGLEYAYLINAVTYAAVILALIWMGRVEQQRDPGRRVTIDLGSIGDGLRFISGHPIILSSMLLDFFATFFAAANTLMPVVARDVLGVGAIEYGWLSAAQSIGAVAAALVFSQIDDVRRQGPMLLAAVVAFGFATIGFGFARAFAPAMLFLALMGASDSVSMIIRNTIRQLQTPDYLRGRMVSVNQLFFMGGPQLGEVEAGSVAQFFGAPFAIISGGIGTLLATVWIARRWPQLRRYNGDEPILAGATAD